MVESFISRSRILGISRDAIVSRELIRTGAAYWALANQMKTLRPKTSAMRLATNTHLILSVLGYAGW
ncbi:hypothetical protein ColKHC_04128 [Colletotrichum higginsianum]|nr:hypothetical protein ColKHC_04128 [Colletotrichum higginsianum]